MSLFIHNHHLAKKTLLAIATILLSCLWLPQTALAQSPPEIKLCDEETPAELGAVSNDNNLLAAFSKRDLSYRLRCDALIVGAKKDDGSRSTGIYEVSIALVNFGVLIALIIIAFANILRIKLDTYTVKKAIPLLIFGVIMANVGMPIIRTIVDFSGVLTAAIIKETGDGGTKTAFIEKVIQSVYKGGAATLGSIFTGISGGGAMPWADIVATVGFFGLAITAAGPFFVGVIMGTIFLILAPAIAFLMLGLLFVARIYVLVILAATSPIAFASLGFEPLKGKIWSWWWSQFIKWTFMVPATFFILWFATRFYEATNGQPDIGTYAITLFLLFYAIQIPLKWGGSIMAKWNDLFIKPVSKALYSPFTASRDYVRKGVPRDVSRFLSSKTLKNLVPFNTELSRRLRDRVPAIPLNVVRTGREFVGELEKENAAKEAASQAVNQGRFYGELIAKSGLGPVRGALRARSLAAQQFATPEGRARLIKSADDYLNSAVGNVRDWRTIKNDPTLLNLLKQREDRAIASGNVEQIAAARQANALLGRKLGEIDQKRYDDALKKAAGGINLSPLNDLYEHLYITKTGLPLLRNVSDNPSGAFNDEARAAIKRLGAAVDNLARKPDEQRQLYLNMVEYLRSISRDFKDLKAIEKDANGLGMANLLIKQLRRLPADVADDVRRELVPNRHRLGAANAQEVIGASSGDMRAAFNNRPIAWQNLQPFIEGDGLNETVLREIEDQRQQNEIRDLFANPIKRQAVKKSLSAFIELQLEAAVREGLIEQTQRANIKSSLLPRLISARVDELPKNLTPADLAAAGLTDAQTQALIGKLRPYQAAVKSFDVLAAGSQRVAPAVRRRPAPATATAPTSPGGAPSTTPPTAPTTPAAPAAPGPTPPTAPATTP